MKPLRLLKVLAGLAADDHVLHIGDETPAPPNRRCRQPARKPVWH